MIANCGKGSPYGRVLHNKRGEPVCEACRLATNIANTKARKDNPEKEAERHRKYREKRRVARESRPTR